MEPSVEQEVREILGLARQYLKAQVDLGVGWVPRKEGVQTGVADDLEAFHQSTLDCQQCRLAQGRRTVVFGSGNPNADILFVGEAPGAEEDRQGVPFVGAAGRLLTRMIESIGLKREAVYIANVIKCRPPGNRDPQRDEIEACEPYLIRQIEMIQPVVICTLGRFAAQTLLQTTESMGRLRGKVFSYRGIKLIPTYHPAALLRNEGWKRPTWEDLKLLRREYDGTQF
ncbi:MAG: uracil-DNA glycosylase [bacterium]|nr:uracil-DNA glycosylase [bacterium]